MMERSIKGALGLVFGVALGMGLAGCESAPVQTPEVTREGAEAGRGFYALYCTSCHGVQAKGNGPYAADLPVPPADLTQLANRYDGFPWSRVMAQVHGYRGRNDLMPEYHSVLDGPTTKWRDEDGTVLETPVVLLQVAQYLAAIQE